MSSFEPSFVRAPSPSAPQSAAPKRDGSEAPSGDILGSRIAVVGYNDSSFRIMHPQKPLLCCGSVLLLPSQAFLWDVTQVEDISVQSLRLFEMCTPAPKMLFVGTGEHQRWLDPSVIRHFKKLGVEIETMSTPNAIGYFNTCNNEGRDVVTALLPWKTSEAHGKVDGIELYASEGTHTKAELLDHAISVGAKPLTPRRT